MCIHGSLSISRYINEVENHIFNHNWIFWHLCIYKQPTLTKYWNYHFFVQILYSHFRYTGTLFLGCAVLVAGCNIIRASRETKKERSSCRKNNIHKFVWGISLFLQHALLSNSFCCFKVLNVAEDKHLTKLAIWWEKKPAVSRKLLVEQVKALAIHCQSHSLSLVIKTGH